MDMGWVEYRSWAPKLGASGSPADFSASASHRLVNFGSLGMCAVEDKRTSCGEFS